MRSVYKHDNKPILFFFVSRSLKSFWDKLDRETDGKSTNWSVYQRHRFGQKSERNSLGELFAPFDSFCILLPGTIWWKRKFYLQSLPQIKQSLYSLERLLKYKGDITFTVSSGFFLSLDLWFSLSLRPVLRGTFVGQPEGRGVTRAQQQDGEGERILSAGGKTFTFYIKYTLYLNVCVCRAQCEWCFTTAGCSTQSTSSWRAGSGIDLVTVSLTSVMTPAETCLLYSSFVWFGV